MSPFKPLEDYGIIGNLETCALIGRDGSIDWLCFPYLDSPSLLAALLDGERGGHMSIMPTTKYESSQTYYGDTNILQTTFTTPLGNATITDFMPVRDAADDFPISAVLRKIECSQGMVKMTVSVKPRFNYATAIPNFEPSADGVKFRHADEFLFFHSPVPLFIHEAEASGSLSLKEGESLWFSLQYNHGTSLTPKDYERLLKHTGRFWLDWANLCENPVCKMEDPWHRLAVRSGLVLKLLSNPESGAISAAATTSLPERIAGRRNWDYRYSWIRDASFTNQAFFHLGHEKESRAFRNWIIRIAERAGGPQEIKTMYPLHEGTDMEERVLEHLSGYEDSRPVRVGNAAAGQRQLDIYGEVMSAIYDTTRHGEEISAARWEVFRSLIDYASKVWNEKDSGIWEMRSGPQHFVYSKLMCWVSLDRGIRIAGEKGFSAPLTEWKKTCETLKETILQRGFSTRLNSFVQSFDSEIIDATGLLIAPLGLVSNDDLRVHGTIDAVIEKLTTKKGLVRRYEGEDGLPEGEGCFLLCSFWLIKALALAGRTEEAEKIFNDILGYIGPLGILSEEVDPESGRLIGNFPQAFSHVGLINSALYLGIAKGRQFAGPKPIGLL